MQLTLSHRPARVALASLLATLFAAAAGGQESQPTTVSDGKKLLTLEAIYGPEGEVDFDGTVERGMAWLDDGRHYLHRRGGVLQRVDALTDEATPAFDHEALRKALEAHADFDERAARRTVRGLRTYSAGRGAVLIEHEGAAYLYRFAEADLRRVTKDTGDRRALSLSPGAGYLGVVRHNDLYAVETASGREHRLTDDGSATTLNGVLDWVYQEEVYGRGRWRAHWWRDDDAYVAFLQLDESGVPVFNIADQVPLHSRLEQTNYPKPGDPNPRTRLGVARPTGGTPVWVDLSKYDDIEFLIVRVAWAPDGKLIYQVQDREQRWLDLNEADPDSGSTRTLIHEASPAWVDVLGHPHWLPDGSFLWRSDRDGYRHLYHHDRDGRLIRRLTRGDWEVRDLHGVDAGTGWVYFSGTRDTAIENHAYRTKLDGGPVGRLTEPGSSHRVQFDPRFRYFIDTFSNATTPPKVYLRNADGTTARVISENEVTVLGEYQLSEPRFVRVPARDGHLLNARLILPPDYEPGKRYPVWSSVYGGPHAPQVHNGWNGSGGMLDQMLAQQGYIIWVCDPRSASGESPLSAWQAYCRLGESELADLEDGARWLIEQGYADPERIGIHGHSYGGFMTAYALTHGDVFTLGIAGAPVTSWHNYDTIYTERFMRTPANNPDGYERTSVVKAAGDLHGRLLVLHGAIDDNVHFQNTLQFIHGLQQSGEQFDLMVYPKDRHGIGNGRRHLREMQLQYVYEKL